MNSQPLQRKAFHVGKTQKRSIRSRQQSIFHADPETSFVRHQLTQVLSSELIRSSRAFRNLEQQIKETREQQSAELDQLAGLLQRRSEEAQRMQISVYESKLQIWNLRNQISQLREQIRGFQQQQSI